MPTSPDTLTRLEAILNRRRLAATSTEERCLWALFLFGARTYRKQQANSGEVVTEATTPETPLARTQAGETSPASARVALSPVGASACTQTIGVSAEALTPNSPRIGRFPGSRFDVARTGSPLLDPLPLSSEDSTMEAPNYHNVNRRQGQRA